MVRTHNYKTSKTLDSHGNNGNIFFRLRSPDTDWHIKTTIYGSPENFAELECAKVLRVEHRLDGSLKQVVVELPIQLGGHKHDMLGVPTHDSNLLTPWCYINHLA